MGFEPDVMMTYFQAEDMCSFQFNARLPIIKSLESAITVRLVQGQGNTGNVWMGMVQEDNVGIGDCSEQACEGRGWTWTDGTPYLYVYSASRLNNHTFW